MKKKFIIIQVLLILVVIACGTVIGKYFYDEYRANNIYDELRQTVEKKRQEDASNGYEDKHRENGMLELYYDLYMRNNDMTGWICIPDTMIDYPVVRYSDNDYYLHRDFDKNYQYSGIPFIDYQCSDNSSNIIIYAHNMKNGSMFAALADYVKKDFYEQHKIIYYDTLYEKGEYEVIAAFTTKVGARNEFKYYEYANIEDEKSFGEYINKVIALSFLDVDAEVGFGDKLITLSTCAYYSSNERIVVVAKKTIS